MDTKRIVLSAVLVSALAVPAGLLVASATQATRDQGVAHTNAVAGLHVPQSASSKVLSQKNEHAVVAGAKKIAGRDNSTDDTRDNEPGGPDTDTLEEGPGPTGDGPD